MPIARFAILPIKVNSAQHGLREAVTAAKNIEAAIAGRPLKPFVFTSLGHYRPLHGRGDDFWGQVLRFYRLGMWRSIYLAKLPGLGKKLRVMMDWTLDLLFGGEIERLITVRDVQALIDRVARLRAQTKRGSEAPTEQEMVLNN